MDAGQLLAGVGMNPTHRRSLGESLPRTCFWFTTILIAITALAGDLPDPVEAGWRGKPVCKILHEDGALRVFRCTFPPGVGHERHFHPRHFGYALSGGTMQITSDSGTRKVTLKTGSYFFSEGIAWHEAVNVGDTTVSYLMVEPK